MAPEKILSEEKIKEGHTDPRKTSAGRRITANVDDEELQNKIPNRIPNSAKYTNKHIVSSPALGQVLESPENFSGPKSHSKNYDMLIL